MNARSSAILRDRFQVASMVSFVFFRISTLFLCCHYRPTSILAYIRTKCKQIVSYFSFFLVIPVISVSLTILGQVNSAHRFMPEVRLHQLA